MGPALPTLLLSAIALLELPLCLESKKQSQMMIKMLQNLVNSYHMDPIVCKSVQTLGVTQEQQLLISSARLTDCFPGFDINSAIFPLQCNPLFFKGHHSQCNPSFVVIVRAIQKDQSCLTRHPPNQEETIHCQS